MFPRSSTSTVLTGETMNSVGRVNIQCVVYTQIVAILACNGSGETSSSIWNWSCSLKWISEDDCFRRQWWKLHAKTTIRCVPKPSGYSTLKHTLWYPWTHMYIVFLWLHFLCERPNLWEFKRIPPYFHLNSQAGFKVSRWLRGLKTPWRSQDGLEVFWCSRRLRRQKAGFEQSLESAAPRLQEVSEQTAHVCECAPWLCLVTSLDGAGFLGLCCPFFKVWNHRMVVQLKQICHWSPGALYS